MRRLFYSMAGIALSLCMAACSSPGVSPEKYQELASEWDALSSECDSLQTQLNEAVSSASQAQSQLQVEFDAYKEKMKPYEKLSEQEAEARKAEAEKAKKQREAEEAAKREAEEAASKAQKVKEYKSGISYDNIARNPNDYLEKKVNFTGTVVQVVEDTDIVGILFAADNNSNNLIYGEYYKTIVSSRVLEGDVITIYGISKGTISYQAVLGNMVTIPSVLIEKIDQ